MEVTRKKINEEDLEFKHEDGRTLIIPDYASKLFEEVTIDFGKLVRDNPKKSIQEVYNLFTNK